jgi:predicted transport protein
LTGREVATRAPPGDEAIDLFQIRGTKLSPLVRVKLSLEKEIQRLLEANLETVLGIRFLASEYSTGEKHAGRIDTLGIDENDTPVIIEYKLTSSVNVVTQSLFYLDWLLDHRGEFEILVRNRLGSEVAVDWTEPRILCVADSFAPYDASAVSRLGPAVQLVEFKLFEGGLLLLNVRGAQPRRTPRGAVPPAHTYSVKGHLDRAKGPMREIAEKLRAYLLALGRDVSEGPTREYIAFRTTRNFCCLEIHQEHILLHLTLDPEVAKDCPICTDVSNLGHFGTGNLRVRVRGPEDVPTAKHFIRLAYKDLSP